MEHKPESATLDLMDKSNVGSNLRDQPNGSSSNSKKLL